MIRVRFTFSLLVLSASSQQDNEARLTLYGAIKCDHPVRTRGENKEKLRRWTFLECLQLTLSPAVPQLLFFISCSSLKLGTIVYSLEQAIPNLSSQAEIKLAICPRALRPAELAFYSSFNYQFGQRDLRPTSPALDRHTRTNPKPYGLKDLQTAQLL